jgi:hypothetical protein
MAATWTVIERIVRGKDNLKTGRWWEMKNSTERNVGDIMTLADGPREWDAIELSQEHGAQQDI